MTTTDPEGDRTKRPSRLEAELAEILERADRPPSNIIKFRAKARQSRTRSQQFVQSLRNAADAVMQFGPGGLLIGALVFALLGSLLNPTSHLLAYVLGLIAIACFIAVFVIGYRDPKGGDVKRWRGKDIELGRPRPSWMNRHPKGPKR
jgi:hypothetical protein